MSFTPIDYALWAGIMLVQSFVCWRVIRSGYFSSWKAFSYYLFFGLLEAPVLFLIAQYAATAYETAYYTASFLEAVLLSLVVLEVLVKILDPFDALPARHVAWFCFWAMIGISASVALSVGPLLPQSMSDWALVTQRTIMLCDAALLWVILLRARAMGITWRSSVAEIALGFAFFLTVQGITRFVTGIYHENTRLMSVADQISQSAFLIALMSWSWTMFHRDPLPPPPTAETLALMRTFTSDTMVTKEKMLAIVGVQIDMADPAAPPLEVQPGPAPAPELEVDHQGHAEVAIQ
jgi:hypothetical protein